MSCDVGKAMESLENEQSSFSKLSIASPTSQFIIQPFFRFSYVTGSSLNVTSLAAHSDVITLSRTRSRFMQ